MWGKIFSSGNWDRGIQPTGNVLAEKREGLFNGTGKRRWVTSPLKCRSKKIESITNYSRRGKSRESARYGRKVDWQIGSHNFRDKRLMLYLLQRGQKEGRRRGRGGIRAKRIE